MEQLKQFNFYLKHNFIEPENEDDKHILNMIDTYSEFNYEIIDDKPYRTIFNIIQLHKGEIQEEYIISLKKIPKPKNTCEYIYCKSNRKLQHIEADDRYSTKKKKWGRRFHKCCDWDRKDYTHLGHAGILKPIFRTIK